MHPSERSPCSGAADLTLPMQSLSTWRMPVSPQTFGFHPQPLLMLPIMSHIDTIYASSAMSSQSFARNLR